MCESCQLGKKSKLPFSVSVSSTFAPLEKVHIDLWGPAPITSVNKFLYYDAIVDDFTMFIWLIPLRQKLDFFHQFILLERYVLQQFEKNIKVVQTDGGGEFMNNLFVTHLHKSGILHQVSCSHTPEQNGYVERRHRNIRELGLTMMMHVNIPKYCWVEVFATAVFLINRLPTITLNWKSPFFMLYNRTPDYGSL